MPNKDHALLLERRHKLRIHFIAMTMALVHGLHIAIQHLCNDTKFISKTMDVRLKHALVTQSRLKMVVRRPNRIVAPLCVLEISGMSITTG